MQEQEQTSPEQARITIPQLVRAMETIEAERAAQADTVAVGEVIRDLSLDVTPERLLAAVRAQESEGSPSVASQSRAFGVAHQRLRASSRAGTRLRGVIAAGLALAALLGASPLWQAERQSDFRSRLFIQAVRAGDLGLASTLINQGADPNTRAMPTTSPTPWGRLMDPLRGRTPALAIAVSRGDARMVELLLNKKADSNVRDSSGSTPLFYLAGRRVYSPGDQEDLRLLLAHGADVNAANDHGETSQRYAESVSAKTQLIHDLQPRQGRAE